MPITKSTSPASSCLQVCFFFSVGVGFGDCVFCDYSSKNLNSSLCCASVGGAFCMLPVTRVLQVGMRGTALSGSALHAWIWGADLIAILPRSAALSAAPPSSCSLFLSPAVVGFAHVPNVNVFACFHAG